MKRPRPYIPLSVRAEVAHRQVCLRVAATSYPMGGNDSRRLKNFLLILFQGRECQLDHDPALILREFNPITGKYTPDANDPNFLVYREKDDHLHKTTGRKPGAAKTVTTKGSDIWLKTKFDRLEGRTKPRRKVKIPARKKPWPKARKFRSKTNG